MRIVASRIQRFGPRGILLELEDEAGRIGVGEASPLPGTSPETLARVQEVLSGIAVRLGPAGDDLSADEHVRRALAPVDEALERAPSARFALETALLDRLGQARGDSIAACLGRESVVPVSGLVR